MATRNIGGMTVGDGAPVFVIAEIGINHDAVKFQKRTPELCVPRDQWGIERDTPWGRMTYIEYRRRMEFGVEEFEQIDRFCRERNIKWFASCWDEPSVDFMEKFEPPCYKVASACITDLSLLRAMNATGRPIMLSTGMSTMDEIRRATSTTGEKDLLIAHSTSSYPCPVDALNLRMIGTLKALYPNCPIGYSGHEVGLGPSWAAAAMGATFLERHITLDRSMWGTDQAASVEIEGFFRLVRTLREIENSLGDGVKRVHAGEIPMRKKLRRVAGESEKGHEAAANGTSMNGHGPVNGVA